MSPRLLSTLLLLALCSLASCDDPLGVQAELDANAGAAAKPKRKMPRHPADLNGDGKVGLHEIVVHHLMKKLVGKQAAAAPGSAQSAGEGEDLSGRSQHGRPNDLHRWMSQYELAQRRHNAAVSPKHGHHLMRLHERIHGHQGQGLSKHEKRAAAFGPLFFICFVGPWVLACQWLCGQFVTSQLEQQETKLR